ncbi:MAG: hypothetical protein GX189_09470 [Clostridiales bacterium]|nr:hypothetical protein [Clostridiales bacterium]
MIKVNVMGGTLPQEEIDAYVARAQKKFPNKYIKSIDITLSSEDSEYVDIAYHFYAVPFERIRRITGYLVGTLERFNDAKRAEEADRVPHTV